MVSSNFPTQEFFNTDCSAPQKTIELACAIEKLPKEQCEHLLLIINDLNKRNNA